MPQCAPLALEARRKGPAAGLSGYRETNLSPRIRLCSYHIVNRRRSMNIPFTGHSKTDSPKRWFRRRTVRPSGRHVPAESETIFGTKHRALRAQPRLLLMDWPVKWLFSILVSAICLLINGNGLKASDESDLATFARDLIDAGRSGDLTAHLTIVHTLSRACVSAETQPYFTWYFARRDKYIASSDYSISVTPLSPGLLPPGSGTTSYPVQPSHQMEIDFESSSGISSVLVPIARDREHWWEVTPCPSAWDIARAVRAQAEDSARRAEADSLIRAMPTTLRNEVVELLKRGQKVDAITRYAEAVQVDISLSKEVIEQLTREGWPP